MAINYLVEITVCQDGKLLLDGRQQPNCNIKPIVGPVSKFTWVLHGTKGTTGLGLHVIGPSRVPPTEGQNEVKSQTVGKLIQRIRMKKIVHLRSCP